MHQYLAFSHEVASARPAGKAVVRTMENTAPAVRIPAADALDRLIGDSEIATQALPLTDEQRAALVKLLQLPFSALQGGAGTGKTTVMKVLSHV